MILSKVSLHLDLLCFVDKKNGNFTSSYLTVGVVLVDIFSYLDYRAFLNDLYEERRKDGLTHREIGRKGDFDPGLFSKVVSGQRNISPKMIPRFCAAFELVGREAKFFELLVRTNQARRQSDRKRWMDELLKLGRNRVSPITQSQHEYYSKWYHTALRELLNFHLCKEDPASLAELLVPEVQPKQAKQAVELLLELGMLERDSEGYLKPTQSLISSGYENQPTGVNQYIQENVELARTALDRFSPTERNLSALTFSFSSQRLPELVARIREFRRSLMDLVDADPDPDRVFQLNLQLFPLSLNPTSVKGRRRFQTAEKVGGQDSE